MEEHPSVASMKFNQKNTPFIPGKKIIKQFDFTVHKHGMSFEKNM